ncbi:exosome complex exonuclease ribosomal rna processing protein [Holotrichia oblita]|uniref:Exosome complex exonuclease ribosomal rna processing protein n=1 Tax=Holotrichia oblita TaxID=644536 RepID=A0ACB9TU69_HOLOL|nr:exosome complex exonuclease ribosomal rna processing protein [Holotrichia oblita]
MTLSEAEKTFILHGVQENFRIDGRNRDDYRPMELETSIITHAFGSARLRLANTDVVVTVKVEIDVPFPDRPLEGKMEFFIDCSANATPDFEGRGGESLATEISNTLTAAYSSNSVFDYTKLCILKGRKCWKIYVDILILECGGNLYDAISIAVKAALWNTSIPLVKSVTIDGNNVDMNVSENLSDCIKLDISAAPLMVTLCKIGDHCVVDPTSAEEQCSQGAIVVAISKGKFSTVLQTGGGSLHPLTLIEKLKLGAKVGNRLEEALSETLSKVKEDGEMGFLN